jgi:thiosulfate reductase cytochrome b subunit
MPLAGFRYIDSCYILRPDSSQLTDRESNTLQMHFPSSSYVITTQTQNLITAINKHKQATWIFITFFLPLSDHFYLLIVCVNGYCCTNHTQWTHIGRTPVDEESSRRRDVHLHLTTHSNHKTHTFMHPWDSNLRSQQASGHRTTSQTARSLGPAI